MKGLIFTYVLTYGGALASLYRPFIGLLIYICFALINPEQLWFWAVPRANYARIVAIALLVGWAMQGFGDWRFGRARGIVYSLLAFLLIWIFDGAFAVDTERGLAGIENLLKIVLPFIAGVTLIDSVSKLKQLVWVIVLSQGYLAYEFNQNYYAGLVSESDFTFRGLDNNGIAIVMDTSVGLALFLGMHSEGFLKKLVAFGSAALMAHVVLFSMSRGGMVGLMIVGGVSFILIPKQPKHYITIFLALLLVLRLAGPSVQKEFLTSFDNEEKRDGSSSLRLKHWSACIESMMRQPLGVGPDCWPLTAPQYGLPAMEAHTTWLQLGAEMGVQGLLSIGLFYGLCISRLWFLTLKRTPVPDEWLRHFARMVIASLSGFIISAQFVSVEGIELPYYVVMIGAATLKLMSTLPAGGNSWFVPMSPYGYGAAPQFGPATRFVGKV